MIELKHIEVWLHMLHVSPMPRNIRSSPEEYAFHTKVIVITIFIMVEGSVIVLIFCLSGTCNV